MTAAELVSGAGASVGHAPKSAQNSVGVARRDIGLS